MEGLDALKISEEKKKYIVELLNPVLEEMVAECIHRMPEDPCPFMLEWLEKKRVEEEDKLLSPQEKERLVKENRELGDSVVKVKSQVQEAAKLAADDNQDEEEEEDDEDDEPPPDFFKEQTGTKARQSVSAEAYGEWNAKKTFVPPVIPKTDEQKERIKNTLSKSFLFSSVEDNDLTIVIGAMKELTEEAGTRVINKGDAGDFLFVIESGKLECTIDGKVVKTCEAGDVFGELALLYNTTRAADVTAKEKCVLYRLDRDTFNNIVKDAAQKKRARYDTFLSNVPLLSGIDAYQRSQIADALKCETFGAKQTIVSQGEAGTKFFIIEEGEAVATKGGVEVMNYSTGDYFGELALIRNQPRAATITTKSAAKILSLEAKQFRRLLNVQKLLDDANKYS